MKIGNLIPSQIDERFRIDESKRCLVFDPKESSPIGLHLIRSGNFYQGIAHQNIGQLVSLIKRKSFKFEEVDIETALTKIDNTGDPIEVIRQVGLAGIHRDSNQRNKKRVNSTILTLAANTPFFYRKEKRELFVYMEELIQKFSTEEILEKFLSTLTETDQEKTIKQLKSMEKSCSSGLSKFLRTWAIVTETRGQYQYALKLEHNPQDKNTKFSSTVNVVESTGSVINNNSDINLKFL